ncbi:MAG TPA: hypothetical protein PLT55_01820 [Acidimicrobiia bacterium]|jgi:hypothetical protein|nr:hypothetical protein [Acidimicrobiia bacterium]
MRRYRQGATKGPAISRPGAGYGRLCFGAPGPTQEVEPREDLVPQLFTGETTNITSQHIQESQKLVDEYGDTIIDITNE